MGTAQEEALGFKGSKGPPSDRGYVCFGYQRQPVHVKHDYFYLDDAEFGEAFIKVCTDAPYGIKIYLNGHEWAKRQLQRQKIAYEALDNGFWKYEQPQRL